MTFLTSQNQANIDLYFSYLKSICSLSKLFSDSNIPYLYYRASENIFCKSFGADNLSRDDSAYDAKKGTLGIGIKTFVYKGKTNSEKIAEFNANSSALKKLSAKDLAYKLAELRNERLLFANRTYGIEESIYHCIARKEKKLYIFETDYTIIDTGSIKDIKETKSGISFKDRLGEYSFTASKTTLYKKFYTPENSKTLNIDIFEDPFELILNLLENFSTYKKAENVAGKDYVILPLYSLGKSKGDKKIVPQQSGLNQWNAGGRPRDTGEVYIPIPLQIHKVYPNFFPSRDITFNLLVPSGESLTAKTCQENAKALMTNPNNALADWLLRKVLQLKERELLTYKKLEKVGIDSVRITKIDDRHFKINFAKTGSYDEFEAEFLSQH